MKSKQKESQLLKGVTIAILAPKGRIGKSLADSLAKAGCKIHLTESLDEILQLNSTQPAQACIAEIGYFDELESRKSSDLDAIESLGSDIIFLASEGKSDEAMACARSFGGFFLTTPVVDQELIIMLERVLDTRLLKSRLSRYETKEQDVDRFGPVIVKSPEMKDVIRIARILSTREDSILFIGPVGSGKELLAKTIHESSSRKHGPFYSISCRSLSHEDLAVELFGRGDPGSVDASEGQNLLEMCEGGTLLLDEIGMISPNIQGKLQRMLEDGTYTRVNSRTVCKADVRIFASSTIPIDEAVAKGDFSEDLYFHLNRFTIHLPALRRRLEDIPVLTKDILQRLSQEKGVEEIKITNDALKLLLEYNWPGNVRELENVLEYAALVAGNEPIESQHLPKQFHDEIGSIFVGSSVDDLPTMSEIEKQYILKVMDIIKGNKVKAAKILDINRATLHRKLQIYETEKKGELV